MKNTWHKVTINKNGGPVIVEVIGKNVTQGYYTLLSTIQGSIGSGSDKFGEGSLSEGLKFFPMPQKPNVLSQFYVRIIGKYGPTPKPPGVIDVEYIFMQDGIQLKIDTNGIIANSTNIQDNTNEVYDRYCDYFEFN